MRRMPEVTAEATSEAPRDYQVDSALGADIDDIPQNQRLVSELKRKANPPRPLSFAKGDAHYGNSLANFKNQDEEYWLGHSGKIISYAQNSSSAAKRIFLELRNIRTAKVPVVSAIPLDDSLDRILASIEGPPETPYQGGVFWITVKLSETDPFGSPLMKFQTKIYHPNISPQGQICANYAGKWASVLSAGAYKRPNVKDPTALWYHGTSTTIQYVHNQFVRNQC